MSNLALAGGLRPQEPLAVPVVDGLCQCGCATPVAGRFVHGHNRRLAMVEPNPLGMCLCGCGQTTPVAVRTNQATGAVAGKAASYLKGHFRPAQHRVINVDTQNLMGDCSKCGRVRIYIHVGGGHRCRLQIREANLLRKYGVTLEMYEQMLVVQQYKCAICKRLHDEEDPLHVDHDHLTDEVNGLLCSPCNTAIGLLKEDPSIIRAALAYAERKAST